MDPLRIPTSQSLQCLIQRRVLGGLQKYFVQVTSSVNFTTMNSIESHENPYSLFNFSKRETKAWGE